MLSAFALAVLYRTVSFQSVGAATLPAVRVHPVNSLNGLATRQTFDVDPESDGNDLRFSSEDTTPRIMGLSTVQFATSLVGLALVVLATLLWLWYRQRKARAPQQQFYVPPFKQTWIPITPAEPLAPPPQVAPSRFSMLKREQADAIPHYGDTHTAPDVLLQTPNGLQLLPGSPPPKKKGYRPFWRQSNGSEK